MNVFFNLQINMYKYVYIYIYKYIHTLTVYIFEYIYIYCESSSFPSMSIHDTSSFSSRVPEKPHCRVLQAVGSSCPFCKDVRWVGNTPWSHTFLAWLCSALAQQEDLLLGASRSKRLRVRSIQLVEGHSPVTVAVRTANQSHWQRSPSKRLGHPGTFGKLALL